jgi:hypothetical protein
MGYNGQEKCKMWLKNYFFAFSGRIVPNKLWASKNGSTDECEEYGLKKPFIGDARRTQILFFVAVSVRLGYFEYP